MSSFLSTWYRKSMYLEASFSVWILLSLSEGRVGMILRRQEKRIVQRLRALTLSHVCHDALVLQLLVALRRRWFRTLAYFLASRRSFRACVPSLRTCPLTSSAFVWTVGVGVAVFTADVEIWAAVGTDTRARCHGVVWHYWKTVGSVVVGAETGARYVGMLHGSIVCRFLLDWGGCGCRITLRDHHLCHRQRGRSFQGVHPL